MATGFNPMAGIVVGCQCHFDNLLQRKATLGFGMVDAFSIRGLACCPFYNPLGIKLGGLISD